MVWVPSPCMRFRVFSRWAQNRNTYVKIVIFLQNFRNAPKASIDVRGWFAMRFWSFRNELELVGSSNDDMKKKINFEHDIGDASYTCLSAGSPSIERRGKQRKRGAELAEGRKLYEASPRWPGWRFTAGRKFDRNIKKWQSFFISFSIREQNLNLQVRRTVWSGSRFRLCVLDCCPNDFKPEIYMSKLWTFCNIFEMHQKHL